MTDKNEFKIRCFKDGDSWCAVLDEGFTDIQKCSCGFGDTPFEAIKELYAEPETDESLWKYKKRTPGCRFESYRPERKTR